MKQSNAQLDGSTSPRAKRSPNRTNFSQVERMVIEISRNDPASSLKPPNSAKRFLMQVMGKSESPPFAAPQLEALRRMAVALRTKSEEHLVAEEAGFYAAGFQASDLVRLTAIIDAEFLALKSQ